MSTDPPADVTQSVLPSALEIVTAWAASETDDPALFRQTLERVLREVFAEEDPGRAVAELIFGMSSISGILLGELSEQTGASREQIIQRIRENYLD